MSVEQRVKQIIVEQLGVDESQVDNTASFVDDLGADSLDIVELVMAFEEAFDIDIPDEDAEKIATVKDAIDYIENKKKKKGRVERDVARRVVVTGVGLLTPLGIGTQETWQAIRQGRNGISTIEQFDPTEFACRIAGEVKNFDPKRYIER